MSQPKSPSWYSLMKRHEGSNPAFVPQVLMNDGEIAGVVVANKTGRSVIRAKAYIDASGDADVAAMAGVPFHEGGHNGELQSATMCYLLAGADYGRFQAYLQKSGDTPQIPLAVQRAQADGALPLDGKMYPAFLG